MLNFSRSHRNRIAVLLIFLVIWSNFTFSQEENRPGRGRSEATGQPTTPPAARQQPQRPANATEPTTPPAARQQPQRPANVAQPATPPAARQQPQRPVNVTEPATPPAARQQPQRPANATEPTTPPAARQQPQRPANAAQPTTPPAARQQPQRPANAAQPTTPPAARQQPQRPERTNPGDTPRSELPSRGGARSETRNDAGDAASLQQQLDDLNQRNRGDRGQNGARDGNGGRGARDSATPNAPAEIAPLPGTIGAQGRGERGERSSRPGNNNATNTVTEGRGRGGPASSNALSSGPRSSSGRDVVTYRPAPPPPAVRPQVVVNIQTGFRGYGTYWTPDWYVRYGRYDYWRPPVVIAPTVWWRTPTWGVTWGWFYGYAPYHHYHYRPAYYTHYVYTAPPTPVYYNYGDNIVYRGDMVYINGVPYVSADKYYEQGLELAKRGENTTVIHIHQTQNVDAAGTTSVETLLDVPVPELPIDPTAQSDDPSEQWMPLGTFAILLDEETGESNQVFQLAMNRGGILRGNLYDQKEDKLLPIQGAVDQETQRVAFQVAGEDEKVYESGLWNLTQESLPLLVQEGRGRSATIKAVRLQENETE